MHRHDHIARVRKVLPLLANPAWVRGLDRLIARVLAVTRKRESGKTSRKLARTA